MEAFDFAFTLFGLVLGLAMAEVLGGFVRVLKARSVPPDESDNPASSSAAIGRTRLIRIGWLTPTIGLLVVLDLISTWILAWVSRERFEISMATLIFGTLVAGVYYIAANLVWPDDPARWPDLDQWFDRHKAQIGAAIAAANIGFATVDVVTNPTAIALPAQLTYIALAASLTVTRRRWQSGLVLAAMLGLIAAYAVGVMG
jgi:hypothetical protein